LQDYSIAPCPELVSASLTKRREPVWSDFETSGEKEADGNPVLVHARMYALGGKYFIPGLKDLAIFLLELVS